MLLYCITLSSSREIQHSAQEVARRISGAVAGEAYARSSQDLDSRQRAISGAVAGESTQKSTYQVPITNPYLSYYIICHLPLVFLSPTSALPFYSPSLPFAFFPYVSLFLFPFAFYMLASSLAENLLIWIHLKCSTWIIFDPYALVLKPQLA